MDNTNDTHRQHQEKDQVCPTDSTAGVTTTGNANVIRRDSKHSRPSEPVDQSTTKSNPGLLLQSGLESLTITTEDEVTGDLNDQVESASDDLDDQKGKLSHAQSANFTVMKPLSNLNL